MSEHSQEHQTFVSEEARLENIKVGISRIIDRLPFKCSPDLTRRDVVEELHKQFVEAGHRITVSDRGWVFATDKSGGTIDLTEQVQESLLCNQSLVDQASVTAALESGTLGVQAKSDLRTVQQKVKFISKFGEEAFTNLPQRRAPKINTSDLGHMTRKEWLSLPLTERSRISGEIGDRGVAEIMDRK